MSKKAVTFFKAFTSVLTILSLLLTPASFVFAQEVPKSEVVSSEKLQTDTATPILDTENTVDITADIPTDEIKTPPDPTKYDNDYLDKAYLDPNSPFYDPDHKEPEDITESTDDTTKDPDKQLASRSATVSQNTLILNSNTQHDTIRPEIDQTTGALVYNYPIETPDGVNGLNPNLKLSYNSQNTKNDSVYGYGWSSNIPYIERINKHGTDQLYTGTYDDYVSSTFGELVKDTSTHYVPKSASDIVDFSFNSNVWTYTDKQGNVYTYGATSASRQDDPGNSSHIYKWMLSSMTDSNGNTITYTYLKDQGQIYPQIINYGIYEIGFNLQARTDVTDSYSKGYLVKTRFVLGGVSLRKVTSPTSAPTTQANMLVVGGGGGGGAGGSNRGHYGGGGAGGYKAFTNQAIVPATAYPIVIGAGGNGNYNGQGLNGGNTTFNNITATGGGGGATYNSNGNNGGSGGGGGGSGVGGIANVGEGNDGGAGATYAGGGGGGSGATGTSGSGSGGAGGNGTANSITGSSVYYAAGGGGGARTGGGGAGGTGGGGNGGSTGPGGSATGYGSGGGGAGWYNYSGGNGSSGIVVISYKTDGSDGIDSSLSTGGTKTTSGSYTIHTFTSNGTLNLVPTAPSGSTLLKNYAIAYTTGHNGARAMISSITPSAYNASSTLTTLPATSFTYNKASSGTATYSSSPSISGMFPGAINNGVVLGDVNGDAYTDIIKSYDYYGYSGVGSYTDHAVYTFNPVTDTYSTSSYTIPTNIINFIQNAGSKYDGGTRVVDLDGNMAPDLVRTPYYNPTNSTASAEQHNGSGWTHLTSGSPSYYPPYASNPFYTVFSGDFNGDGLTDYMQDVQAWPATTPTTSLSMNNGSSFTTSGSTFTGTHTFNTGNDHWLMIDLNGDGLDDLIKADAQVPCSGPTTYDQAVYINNGTTWVLDTTYQLPSSTFTIFSNACYSSSRLPMEIGDFNGDGLTDIMDFTAQSLYINQGKSFSVIGNPGTGFYNSMSGAAAACTNCSNPYLIYDINADGSPDIVNNTGNWMWDNTITAPTDLMSAITLPTGGSMAVTYQSSPKYEDGSGNSLNPTNPVFLQTVKSILTTDPVTSTTSTTSYEYAGGSYYYNTPFDRKFAGFEKVTEIRPDSTKVVNYYLQGNGTNSSYYEYSDNVGKIGYIYRTDVLDSSGTQVSRSTTKYGSSNPVTGAYFVYPTQTINETAGANTATTYSYNTTTGNLSSTVDYGKVIVTDPLNFTDTGSDLKTTNYSYATNGGATIYKVSDKATYDQSSTKVNETKYYYDLQSLGTLTVGNNTKVSQLKSGTTFVDTLQQGFNSYGNVTSSTDARGKITTYTYDTPNIHVATVSNPLTQSTSYVYDYNTGKLIQTTDQNGFVYQTTYDGFGRPLLEKAPDLSSPTTLVNKKAYVYTDTPSSVAVQVSTYLDGSNVVDGYQYFDGLGRLLQERAETESSFVAKDYGYNSLGQLQKESLPYVSSGSSKTSPTVTTTLYTNYTYDPLSRVLTKQDNVGTTNYAYTGFKTTITDPRGKTTDYYNDAYGNLIQVDEHNSGSTYTTAYTWDLNNKLTNITDALGNTRDFTYDKMGRRLTAEDLHASADTTYGSWSYTYDDASNMTQSVSPLAKTTNYTYDDINRILTENYTGATGTEITYVYDTCTNGVGKLCTTTMTSGANTAYTYDANGNTASEVKTVNGNTYTTSYTYDRQGHQLIITYPDGAQVRYTYNNGGLLEKVEQKESGGSFTNVVSNFDYSPVRTATTIAYNNGVTTTNTYDATALYRLTNKVSINGASSHLQDTTYTYDANGNITHIVDASNTDGAKDAVYTYDDLNRLLTATITSVPTGQTAYTQTYVYNAIGNIISGPVGTYVYNGSSGSNWANPHAATSINGVTNTYDKDGNNTGDGTLTNTWNYKDQLTRTVKGPTTIDYLYDYTGDRSSYTDGTTTTDYANKYYNYDGAKKVKQIFAGNQLVGTTETVGVTVSPYYVHTDTVIGSNVVSDGAGAKNQLLDYMPFGKVRINQQATSFNERNQFGGHPFDLDTGLNYVGARYMNTNVGRFISEDPISWTLADEVLRDPQQLNSYSYARNNPISNIDPDGKRSLNPVSQENFNSFANSRPEYSSTQVQSGSANLPYYYRQTGDPANTLRVNTEKFQQTGRDIGTTLAVALITEGLLKGGPAVRTGGIPDDALVVRGGGLGNQSASKIDEAIARSMERGGINGFSVQCDASCTSMDQLGQLTQHLRNSEVAVTRAGEIRKAGGVIENTGSGSHATVFKLSGDKASSVFKNIFTNPKPKL